MPSISAININQTSARGVIEDLFYHAGYYELFEIELWNYDQSSYYYTREWTDSSGVNQYTYYDISGLSPGTGYTFKGFVRNASGRTHVGNVSFYTDSPPQPPSSPTNFRWTSKDTGSVSLAWDYANGANSYSLEVYFENGTTPIDQYYGLTSNTKYVMGLFSDTAYTFKLYAVNDGGNSYPVFVTVTTDSLRPDDWVWSSLVTNAAVYSSGNTLRANVVNATEWNAFCARINEFRQFRSLTNYNFTAANTGESLTDSMAMEAVNAINEMTPVSIGAGPYSTLMNLKDALNSI